MNLTKLMSMETVIVDDDKIICFLHKKLCSRSGMDSVRIFTDPEEAVAYLKAGCEKGTKFLLLLDINMPVMNGWDVLEVLENESQCGNIEVIMVTSSIDDADLQRSKKYDKVRGFVSKPLNLDKLQSITERETFFTLL